MLIFQKNSKASNYVRNNAQVLRTQIDIKLLYIEEHNLNQQPYHSHLPEACTRDNKWQAI